MVGRVEQALHGHLGRSISVVVRSAPEVAAIIAGNLIPEAREDGRGLHVMFLADAIADQERAAVEAIDAGPDVVRVGRHEIYVWYRNGMSGSTTAEQLGHVLTTTVTDRNWNTVVKVRDALG